MRKEVLAFSHLFHILKLKALNLFMLTRSTVIFFVSPTWKGKAKVGPQEEGLVESC
jgi:hypothetical protein